VFTQKKKETPHDKAILGPRTIKRFRSTHDKKGDNDSDVFGPGSNGRAGTTDSPPDRSPDG
jgi:hypothetical protein